MLRMILVLVTVLAIGGRRTSAEGDAKSNRAAAEQLFRLGTAAYNIARYDAAVVNLERAYELLKDPAIAYSAAQAHRMQYQVDRDPVHAKRAIELFEIYVAATPNSGKRRDAVNYLERLRDVVGRLEASVTKVIVEKQTPSIYVSTATERALITIDGKAVDRYKSHDVDPGEHVVAVSADGYVPEQRKVQVTKGQVIVPIELVPQSATLTVKRPAGAHVLVDGRELTGTEVEPGKRVVTVYARGRQPVTQELVLAPGQELAVDVPLHPTIRRRAVKWVAFGTGALLLGTLVTGTIAIASDYSAAKLRDSSDPIDAGDARRYEKLRDRRDGFRNSALVLGGATLAATGVALWLYYFDTPSSTDLVERTPSSSGGLAPLVLGDGAGLSFTRVWQ